MISSMTSYALCETKGAWGNATWELRSVNQRYLEVHIRLPETFYKLESIIRERIRNSLTRGKIECNLHINAISNTKAKLQLDEFLAKQLIQAAKWIKIQSDDGGIINPLDILRWPGIILEQKYDFYAINTELLIAFDSTINNFITNRKNEGIALKSFIEKRLEQVIYEVDKIRLLIPEVIKYHNEKLITKLKEAEVTLDNHRLEQELVMIAQRIDISEEIDRINTYVKETYNILTKKTAIGRRLDFIMQEFNREANTLASKANNASITSSAIELKVLIEQMREQIQNIE
ncbi:YicC/YloC family endoribonuclease [Pantoea sp. Mhis]|uniref:YicC/YloC family endoribonuclease n=1 Tax=Pantoea sp. Mhis TaxID=2576759 RepID=UPI001357B3B5|nr:YicC/YloC family endoribonuclease [Pantoea sp. Mhis]MXP56661.1 YicC family protein [Pantoea sp. Mhis]